MEGGRVSMARMFSSSGGGRLGAGHAIPAQVDPCVCLEGMSLPRLKSVNSIGSFSSGIEERRKGAVNGPWAFFFFLTAGPFCLSCFLFLAVVSLFACLLDAFLFGFVFFDALRRTHVVADVVLEGVASYNF